MNRLKKICLLILTITLLLSSCGFNSKLSSEFFAMDTVMTITAYGGNSDEVVSSAIAEINKIDKLLSIQNKSSEIFKLNRDKELTPSKATLEIIRDAIKVSKLTNGAFDPTSQPLSEAWGFYSGLKNKVPSNAQIKTALNRVDFNNISIKSNRIVLKNNASIDLGAIAKGYASAKAGGILKANGVQSALISLGGNVRAIGAKPDNSPWNIAIADPDNPENNIASVSVTDKAVITSGGYQRNFKSNGKLYHHIMDTTTGYPAQSGLKSVTIISEDDTLADALSTALYVMGLDKAEKLYRTHKCQFDAVFITDSNEIYITDNIQDCFFSEHSFEVITG